MSDAMREMEKLIADMRDEATKLRRLSANHTDPRMSITLHDGADEVDLTADAAEQSADYRAWVAAGRP